MLRISQKASLLLSLLLTVAFGLALLGVAVLVPRFFEEAFGYMTEVTDAGAAALTVIAYAMLAVAMLADGLLFALLLRVKNGLVFTAPSIALVRGVSWCCMLVAVGVWSAGLLLTPLYYFGYVFFGVAFAPLLLGLCLRVVKNVLEQAADIKSENDLTV